MGLQVAIPLNRFVNMEPFDCEAYRHSEFAISATGPVVIALAQSYIRSLIHSFIRSDLC